MNRNKLSPLEMDRLCHHLYASGTHPQGMENFVNRWLAQSKMKLAHIRWGCVKFQKRSAR